METDPAGITSSSDERSLPLGSVVVSPHGDPAGDGSLEHPLDLAAAIGPHGPVDPGGEVLLRGGTYVGTFTSELEGTLDEPITIRSAPGEWAVLDAGTERGATLTVNGAYVRIQDLEVMRSDPRRTTSQAGSSPDISRGSGSGIDVFAPYSKLIGLIVHDASNGIGLWKHAVGAEVSDCIVFNNGWVGPDRAHGHGIYVQNRHGTKRIRDTLVFNNFGYGIHAYDTNGDVVGLRIDDVVSFQNGAPGDSRFPNLLIGDTGAAADRIEVRSSTFFASTRGINVRLGYAGKRNGSLIFEDNTVIGGSRGVLVADWRKIDLTRNVITRDPASGRSLLVQLWSPTNTLGPHLVPPGRHWDTNRYFDGHPASVEARRHFMLHADPNESSDAHLTFSEWSDRAGVDNDSSYRSGVPRQESVEIAPSAHDHGRAHITVLNWARRNSVALDLSEAGLEVGDTYEIYDVEHLSEPVLTGRFDGTSVQLPVDGRRSTAPVGHSRGVPHTPRDFGVFVLAKTAT